MLFAYEPKWPIRPEPILVSVALSDYEYCYSPLDGMLVHRRVTPSIKFAGNHLYTWVERGTVRVNCLANNTTQCPWPGLQPGPLDLELSSLTMRPVRLPLLFFFLTILQNIIFEYVKEPCLNICPNINLHKPGTDEI